MHKCEQMRCAKRENGDQEKEKHQVKTAGESITLTEISYSHLMSVGDLFHLRSRLWAIKSLFADCLCMHIAHNGRS